MAAPTTRAPSREGTIGQNAGSLCRCVPSGDKTTGYALRLRGASRHATCAASGLSMKWLCVSTGLLTTGTREASWASQQHLGDILPKNVVNDSGSSSWNFNGLVLELRLSAIVKAWLSVNVGTNGTASHESSTCESSSASRPPTRAGWAGAGDIDVEILLSVVGA